MTRGSLAGLGVLVTRPEPAAAALASRLEARGARTWRLPGVDIDPHTPDPDVLEAAIAGLSRALYIFVSRPAVRFGLKRLGVTPEHCLAVGPATLGALREAGAEVLVSSEGFDSEALLALDELADPRDRDVFIVRGAGGRALLGDTLTERGARVHYLEVYRRSPPRPDPAHLADILAAWRHGGIQAYTATSVEIFESLANLLGSRHRDLLAGTALVTASSRVIQRAAEQGHRAARLAATGPDDDSLAAALAEWWESQGDRTGRAAMNEKKSGEEPRAEKNDPAASSDPAPDPPASEETASAAGPDADAEARPPPAPPEEEGGGSGRGLAFLALLVGLAALAASGFQWWTGQGRDTTADQDTARIEGGLGRLEAEISAVEGQVAGFVRDVGLAVRRGDELDRELDVLRRDIAALGARDDELLLRLEETTPLPEATRAAPEGPLLAETEYLLRVAAREVGLAGRAGVAATALEAADRNLAELDDPSYRRVRAQIASDLEALAGAQRADTAGIAMRLGSLASRAETLPLAESLMPDVPGFPASSSGDTEASGWNRLVGKVRGFFSDLFRVRSVESDARPMLSPEEAFFLYRSLELDLKTARLAALNEDSAGYREALRAARGSLERYFDTDDAAVKGALNTLAELEGLSVKTEYPEVAGSLAIFRATRPGLDPPPPLGPEPADPVIGEAETDEPVGSAGTEEPPPDDPQVGGEDTAADPEEPVAAPAADAVGSADAGDALPADESPEDGASADEAAQEAAPVEDETSSDAAPAEAPSGNDDPATDAAPEDAPTAEVGGSPDAAPEDAPMADEGAPPDAAPEDTPMGDEGAPPDAAPDEASPEVDDADPEDAPVDEEGESETGDVGTVRATGS